MPRYRKLPAAGHGPRHLAFHPVLDVVYVSGELDSTVSVFAYTPATGALAEVHARLHPACELRG